MEVKVEVSVDVDEELDGDALVELAVSDDEVDEELAVDLVEDEEASDEEELLSDVVVVPEAEATESDAVTLPDPDAAAASASQYHGFRVAEAVAVVVVVVALVLSGKPTSPAICSAKAAAMSVPVRGRGLRARKLRVFELSRLAARDSEPVRASYGERENAPRTGMRQGEREGRRGLSEQGRTQLPPFEFLCIQSPCSSSSSSLSELACAPLRGSGGSGGVPESAEPLRRRGDVILVSLLLGEGEVRTEHQVGYERHAGTAHHAGLGGVAGVELSRAERCAKLTERRRGGGLCTRAPGAEGWGYRNGLVVCVT